jgi:Fe2+ transport system protein FeoA
MTPDMPLMMATPGEDYVVVRMHTGRGSESMIRRLIELGFKEGAHVRVLNSHGRSIVVDLDGARYVLCRGMAKKVFIKEC